MRGRGWPSESALKWTLFPSKNDGENPGQLKKAVGESCLSLVAAQERSRWLRELTPAPLPAPLPQLLQ